MLDRTRSQYAIHAWDFLFQHPIFKGSTFIERSRVPPATARRILNVLRDEGLLKEIRPATGRRSAVFAFAELLNVAEGKPVF